MASIEELVDNIHSCIKDLPNAVNTVNSEDIDSYIANIPSFKTKFTATSFTKFIKDINTHLQEYTNQIKQIREQMDEIANNVKTREELKLKLEQYINGTYQYIQVNMKNPHFEIIKPINTFSETEIKKLFEMEIISETVYKEEIEWRKIIKDNPTDEAKKAYIVELDKIIASAKQELCKMHKKIICILIIKKKINIFKWSLHDYSNISEIYYKFNIGDLIISSDVQEQISQGVMNQDEVPLPIGIDVPVFSSVIQNAIPEVIQNVIPEVIQNAIPEVIMSKDTTVQVPPIDVQVVKEPVPEQIKETVQETVQEPVLETIQAEVVAPIDVPSVSNTVQTIKLPTNTHIKIQTLDSYANEISNPNKKIKTEHYTDEVETVFPEDVILEVFCHHGKKCYNIDNTVPCGFNHVVIGTPMPNRFSQNKMNKGDIIPPEFCKFERPWKQLRCWNINCKYVHIVGRVKYLNKYRDSNNKFEKSEEHTELLPQRTQNYKRQNEPLAKSERPSLPPQQHSQPSLPPSKPKQPSIPPPQQPSLPPPQQPSLPPPQQPSLPPPLPFSQPSLPPPQPYYYQPYYYSSPYGYYSMNYQTGYNDRKRKQ